MCDGQTNQGAMMATNTYGGPLSGFTEEELELIRRDRHTQLHEVIDALGGVFGRAATTELRIALNNEYESDGELVNRLRNRADNAEGMLRMVSAELDLHATEVGVHAEATAAVVEEGIGRYSKAKVPAWAKDASVAATKAKGVSDRLTSMAERLRGYLPSK